MVFFVIVRTLAPGQKMIPRLATFSTMGELPLLPYELVDAIAELAASDRATACSLALVCRRMRSLATTHSFPARLLRAVPSLTGSSTGADKVCALVRKLHGLDPQLVQRSCLMFESGDNYYTYLGNFLTVYLDLGGHEVVEVAVSLEGLYRYFVCSIGINSKFVKFDRSVCEELRKRTRDYAANESAVNVMIHRLLEEMDATFAEIAAEPMWRELIGVAWVSGRGLCRMPPIFDVPDDPFAIGEVLP